jgi:hypothetical protein
MVINYFKINFIKTLCLLSCLSSCYVQAQSTKCQIDTKKVFDNLINNIANSMPAPPDLEIVYTTKKTAYISNGVIYVEARLIDLLCSDDNFESKIAYVLSHELAHHYNNHGWASTTGFTYYTSAGQSIDENIDFLSERLQRKKDESQADLFGGFFSQISGYNALLFGEETLRSIYDEYSIKDSKKYPSLEERVELINYNIKRSTDLAKIFKYGNMALAIGKLETARNCFKEIIKNNFVSREIYNNLGLSYLLFAVDKSNEEISKYSYPIFIEQNTRAEISSTRSASFNNDPTENLKDAIKYFEYSLRLDSSFEPAKINLLVSNLILNKIEKTLNKDFYKKLENTLISDQVKINDLKVIYLLFEDNVRRASKLASKGSNISLFNIDLNSKSNNKKGVIFSDEFNKMSDFNMFIFGLTDPDNKIKFSINKKIQINNKKEKYFTVYEFKEFGKNSYIKEYFDPEYIKPLESLNIKFDNISLISNYTFKKNKKNKVIFKYFENELISVIFYQ